MTDTRDSQLFVESVKYLDRRLAKMEAVCAAVYQAFGALASFAGVFHEPQVQQVLDLLSAAKSREPLPDDPIAALLPWPSPLLPDDAPLLVRGTP